MADQGFLRRRVPLLIGLILVAVGAAVGLEGCSWTPGARVELGPGQDVTVGEVQGQDLKLVTEGAGQPARLLGTLVNPSDASVEVTVRDADDLATVAVSEGDSFSFTDSPTIFATIDAAIGEEATMTLTSPAGQEDVLIPVYEGPIGGYEHYTSDRDNQ
jgi:hypothetical protein